MYSRGKKILQMALAQFKNEENATGYNDKNNNRNSPKEDDPNNIFGEMLSPEDLSEIINNAEIVFAEESLEMIEEQLHVKVTNDDHPKNLDEVLELTEGQEIHQEGTNYDGRNNFEGLNATGVQGGHCEYQELTNVEHNKNLNLDADFEMGKDEINFEAKEIIENQGSKKRKIIVDKRKLNKKLRMSGKEYLGFRKPKNQKNTFQDTKREERKIKQRCSCNSKVKDPTKKCFEVSEEERKTIFNKFWSDMTWEQRQIYVSNTVKVCEKKRPKAIENDESRRSVTLKYHLIVKNKDLPVCKKMYLNSLCLGEWSVRSWALKSENGMNKSREREVESRNKRQDIFREEKTFLKHFFTNLNKLPSHYCRKDTTRMYLEQCFQSWMDLYKVYKNECVKEHKNTLSFRTMRTIAEEMNLSIFQPRKDKCDICFMYKNGNEDKEKYERHIMKKEQARKAKEVDKEKSLRGESHVITVDVQAVKLSPQIPASSLYYKTKLCCHNFTIYNLATKGVTCYWYDESNADGQASTFASFLVDYLEQEFLSSNTKLPIIIFSDGCTAQNRNAILSNALLYLTEKYKVSIYQKFLEKGHTQMESDSVHSSIEHALKNKVIYLPSDYHKITKQARSKSPYAVKNFDYTFFRNFGIKDILKYHSIRPGGATRSTVTDIRVLQYSESKIRYKLNYESEFEEVPVRPKNIDLAKVVFPALYKERLQITKTKYDHLQSIKKCIPKDCWPFYDNLLYKQK